MNILIKEPKEADEWALNICKEIKSVKEYWNPIGGKDFFDRKKYQDAKINLLFHNINIETYNQKRMDFIPACVTKCTTHALKFVTLTPV
ncbi:MAG TPA: hypothetical protein ENK96_01710 [Desulfobulbaceae bacterium]|nr:hypothetical protein [Desulfobulbaceae bacterium]